MAGKKSNSELEESFKAFDKDNNGYLTKEEVKALLQQGNCNIPDSVLNEVFQYFDGPSGDNRITFEEFHKGLQKLEDIKRELREIFNEHDKDKSGFLDLKELECILREYAEEGLKFDDAEIAKILKEVDKSGDGLVSFDEFINAFT